MEGWNAVFNANPKKLLDRGYDKVICITRTNLITACKVQAHYHRQVEKIEDCIRLILSEPHFFKNIERKWDNFNEELEDDNFFRLDLKEWNLNTREVFERLLDFLGYPKENRIYLAPVKSERDYEKQSCSHKNLEVNPHK